MQTPRSILLHVDSSVQSAQRVKVARQLAEAFESEVTGQSCRSAGVKSSAQDPQNSPGDSVMLQPSSEKTKLDKAYASFVQERGDSERMHWAHPLDEGPKGFALRALYADLIVMGQRDGSDPATSDLPVDFLSDAMVRSGRPALILPCEGPRDPLGGNVLVAWKSTQEAAHALTAALPWLFAASHVHILCCGNDAPEAPRMLHRQLAVRRITFTGHDGGAEPRDFGHLLLTVAADVDADLIVMGGYGYSRNREWVMGGATRTVLHSMTLPVLMAH